MCFGYYIVVDYCYKFVILCICGIYMVYDIVMDFVFNSEGVLMLDGESVYYGSVEVVCWFMEYEMSILKNCLEEYKV